MEMIHRNPEEKEAKAIKKKERKKLMAANVNNFNYDNSLTSGTLKPCVC